MQKSQDTVKNNWCKPWLLKTHSQAQAPLDPPLLPPTEFNVYPSKFSDSWRPRGWVARWRLTSASFPPLFWASPSMSPNTPWWGESKCRLPTQQPLLSWKRCPSLWAPGTYNRSIRKYSNKIQAYPQNTTYQKKPHLRFWMCALNLQL